jgi:hypothetical protein
MNLEKALYPKANKLNKNGKIDIVDADLDLIKCQVVGDSVEINTKDYTYLTLTKDNLLILIAAIDEMENDLEE